MNTRAYLNIGVHTRSDFLSFQNAIWNMIQCTRTLTCVSFVSIQIVLKDFIISAQRTTPRRKHGGGYKLRELRLPRWHWILHSFQQLIKTRSLFLKNYEFTLRKRSTGAGWRRELRIDTRSRCYYLVDLVAWHLKDTKNKESDSSMTPFKPRFLDDVYFSSSEKEL